MGILRRDRTDDVDVESCLANLHRVEAWSLRRVVDLTAPGSPGADVAVADLRSRPATRPAPRTAQPVVAKSRP